MQSRDREAIGEQEKVFQHKNSTMSNKTDRELYDVRDCSSQKLVFKRQPHCPMSSINASRCRCWYSLSFVSLLVLQYLNPLLHRFNFLIRCRKFVSQKIRSLGCLVGKALVTFSFITSKMHILEIIIRELWDTSTISARHLPIPVVMDDIRPGDQVFKGHQTATTWWCRRSKPSCHATRYTWNSYRDQHRCLLVWRRRY